MDKTLGDLPTARKLAENPNLNHDQLHRIIDTYGAGQTNVPGKRRLEEAQVMEHAMRHPNANETHFNKMFEIHGLQHDSSDGDKISSSIELDEGLRGISERYHSEDIGRKLISALPHNVEDTYRGHHMIVANVARSIHICCLDYLMVILPRQ